jgi:hypothetical protein
MAAFEAATHRGRVDDRMKSHFGVPTHAGWVAGSSPAMTVGIYVERT